MQVTIEIPDDLAAHWESQRENLVEVIRRSLRSASDRLSVVGEVFEFLARRPSPEAVLAFRPSEQASARLRDLLERNRESALTAEEEAELDTLQSLNHFFALLKAQARQQAQGAA